MAKKGHNVILNENNPRMICRDGTVVPIYYFENLFYLPFVTTCTPILDSGGFSPTATESVDEAEMLSSTISIDHALNMEQALPEEAVVRLDARPAPDNKIKISTELSDQMVANSQCCRRVPLTCFL